EGKPLWKYLEGGEEVWRRAAGYCREEGKHTALVSLVRKDAPPVAADMVVVPRHDGGGDTIGYVAVLNEVSGREQSGAGTDRYTERLRSLLQDRSGELILKNRELEQANRNMVRLHEKMEMQHARLKAAHDFLDNILNTIPTGVFTVDREGRITSFNRFAEQITGFGAAEVIGRKCAILRGGASTGACDLFDDGSDRQLTGKKCTILGKDGRPIDIIKNASTLRDESGNVVGGVESFVDITKLSEAEKKLREAEGHLQNVLSCAVDVAVFTTDCDGTLTFANEGVQRLFDQEPRELIGEKVQETLFQSDEGYSLWSEITGHALENGRFEGTVGFARKNARPLKTYLTLMPLTNIEGRHYGYVAVSRARTDAEEKYVSPVEKMTHEILTSMSEPSLMLTSEAVVCCANDSGRRLFGAKVGQEWQPEFDSAEKWWNGEVFESLLSGDNVNPVTFEAAVGHRSYEITLTPVTSKDIEGTLIVTGRDVTESAALRNQMVQQDRLATIGTLAAGVVHDLNNILGGILGYASLARKDGAYTKKLLDVLETQGARATEMLQGLLDFSRKPQRPVEFAELPRVADEVLALVKRDMEKHGIEIRRDYQSVPKTLLNVGQIQQVLLNLFINARQAMKDGGTLTVASRRERDNVVIRVSDTGCGIRPEDRARVFQPFYTTKSAGKDGRRDGVGLGLSVSYNIVKKHRGSIRIESEHGKGSTFIVALPVVGDSSGAAQSREHENQDLIWRTKNARKIMVVDDEAVLRSLYREILTAANHEVVCVEEGGKALELLAAEQFDLVFLDITLPGDMNGIETFENVRRIAPGVKVVLATGSLEHARIQPYIDRADAFLQKPFTMNDLLPLANEL
ncbi:MAG: hypothetical protein DRP79_02010, partial [Planctomycetota bacterium]